MLCCAVPCLRLGVHQRTESYGPQVVHKSCSLRLPRSWPPAIRFSLLQFPVPDAVSDEAAAQSWVNPVAAYGMLHTLNVSRQGRERQGFVVPTVMRDSLVQSWEQSLLAV